MRRLDEFCEDSRNDVNASVVERTEREGGVDCGWSSLTCAREMDVADQLRV